MSKALQFSILIATILIPMRLASAPDPKKALRQVIKQFVLYNFIYILILVYIVPRL